VLDYLRQNQDIMIPYQEIMRALTLPASTVGNSVGYLITRGNLAIERPMKGTAILHSGKAILSPETIAQLESDRRYAGVGTVTVNEPLMVEAPKRPVPAVTNRPNGEYDVVSAYPEMPTRKQITADAKAAAAEIALMANAEYGKRDTYVTVGHAGARTVIADDDERLYVAEPLEAYLS
jgi:hypothetical protein